MAVVAEVKGKKLIITVDIEAARPSNSGKTTIHATSAGPATTEAKIDGKPVIVNLNAYTK